jgi:hypothetical protein
MDIADAPPGSPVDLMSRVPPLASRLTMPPATAASLACKHRREWLVNKFDRVYRIRLEIGVA